MRTPFFPPSFHFNINNPSWYDHLKVPSHRFFLCVLYVYTAETRMRGAIFKEKKSSFVRFGYRPLEQEKIEGLPCGMHLPFDRLRRRLRSMFSEHPGVFSLPRSLTGLFLEAVFGCSHSSSPSLQPSARRGHFSALTLACVLQAACHRASRSACATLLHEEQGAAAVSES